MPATLVEFYDKSPIENVVSGLIFKPDRIIFLGSNRKQMERQMARYHQLFEQKNIMSELQCRAINKNNFSQIKEIICEIASSNPGCVFDLTGGDELSLAAAGSVANSLEDRKISFHRVNVQTRRVTDLFKPDNEIGILSDTLLNVRENIALYGGSIVSDAEKEGAMHIWDWSEDFCRDAGKMWEICKTDCGNWNAQITALENLNPCDGLNVYVTGIRGGNAPYEAQGRIRWKMPWNKCLLGRLANEKLILNYRFDAGGFSFAFKNEQVKRCLMKAGQALELKTYLLARSLTAKDGAPFFNDVMTGVYIDWDGEIHQYGESVPDTENEIDVAAMKGLIPYFISCKNGSAAEEELYKLNTVATRFGGNYAKKVLIATYIDRNKSSLNAFRQRAKDMNIELLEGVHMLDDAGFSRKLRGAFGG